jgi:hypothetical protein
VAAISGFSSRGWHRTPQIIAVPKSFQRSLDSGFQGLQIFVDYSPDKDGINAIVFVSQYVSYRTNLGPRLVRDDVLDGTFELARGL